MIYISNFIVLTASVLIILYAYKLLMTIAMPNRAVLISSRTKYVEKVFLTVIKKYVTNSHEMNFIELGSGYAKIAKIAALNFKWKSIIAIEIDGLVVFWMKLKNFFQKLPITYVSSDVLKYEIPKESVVYCYMSVSLLNTLYKASAFDGSLLMSLSFGIEGVEPIAEYKVKGFQKRIYVYDFR